MSTSYQKERRTAVSNVSFYADDWLAGTMELTAEQRGVFITLCAIYTSKQGRVPENDRWLSGMCNMSVRRWRTLKKQLIQLGKIEFIDGFLFQERAEIELINALKAKDASIIKGSKGGRKSAEIRAKVFKRNKSTSSPASSTATSTGSSSRGRVPSPSLIDIDSPPTPTQSKKTLADGKNLKAKHVRKCVEIWNKTLSPYGREIKYPINDGRHKKLTARIRDQLGSIKSWREYCERIARSDYVMGKKERPEKYKNWKPTFDWAIKRSTCDKVLEGNYDNEFGSGEPETLSAFQKALLDWDRGGEKGQQPKRSDF